MSLKQRGLISWPAASAWRLLTVNRHPKRPASDYQRKRRVATKRRGFIHSDHIRTAQAAVFPSKNGTPLFNASLSSLRLGCPMTEKDRVHVITFNFTMAVDGSSRTSHFCTCWSLLNGLRVKHQLDFTRCSVRIHIKLTNVQHYRCYRSCSSVLNSFHSFILLRR